MRFLVPFTALLSVAQALSVPGLLGRAPILDVCASLNIELVVPDLLGILTAVGVIDVCLCLSALPLFLETNGVAVLAVTVAGDQAVEQILRDLINQKAPNPQDCGYPDHSTPACVSSDPCGFTCMDGFVSSPSDKPTSCVCQPPMQNCNGVCTPAATCPSSTPSHKRSESWWQSTMACEFGYTACGTTSSSAYECVDTRSDLESCGGCSILFNDHSPRGRDCSSIPGVADVSCRSGSCRVYECMPGYRLSYDNSTCYDENRFRNAKMVVQKYRAASGLV